MLQAGLTIRGLSFSNRVCSTDFESGAKKYMNNVPTIVPITIKLEKPKPRNSQNNSGERHRFSFSSSACGDIDENMETEITESTHKERLTTEVERLKED